MYLLDNSNQTISKIGFTLASYVKSYTYVGQTRIYVAVGKFDDLSFSENPDLLPPELTPQKQGEPDETSCDIAEASDKGESSHSTGKETDDDIQSESELLRTSRLSVLVKNDISMDDVRKEIQQGIKDKTYDKQDVSITRPGFVPLYLNNVVVKYFVDLKQQEGVNLEIIASSWGAICSVVRFRFQ